MDFEKLAYDLAMKYVQLRIPTIEEDFLGEEDKADELLNSFKFAYDHYLEVFGMEDK